MRLQLYAVVIGLAACGDSSEHATVAFDLNSDLTQETFFDLPFPSDLRLNSDGTINLEGFPNRRAVPIVDALVAGAKERKGFPVMPVAWFRFTDPTTLPTRTLADVLAGTIDDPILLIDVDTNSPERGKLFPVVSEAIPDDDYASPGVLAVAPRPGTVLRPLTRYAIVLRTALARDVSRPPQFEELAKGKGSSSRAQQAKALYEPMWSALAMIGVAADDVLSATVFTTGDEVKVLADRSEKLRKKHTVEIAELTLAPIDATATGHDGFCHFIGSVTLPQFQTGEQPFNTLGTFVLDADGVPVKQRDLKVPVHITIPRRQMPAGGWPLLHYFHGSGGLSNDNVDLGPQLVKGGPWIEGKGPGWVVAKSGIATAATALPLNPERYPGATDYQYLNINNLQSFPYTFSQGVIEQRMVLDALLRLRVPAATAQQCTGLTLANGDTEHKFDASKLAAGGHSMGGMYTNMIGAVDDRYAGFTPFGAGGFWPLMILQTAIYDDTRSLLAGVIGTEAETFTFVHPALAALGMGWEIAEPGASMARIARRPLVSRGARHVYQPLGENDKYFPNPVFDAATLAFGNQLAGDSVWPETGQALTLDGLGTKLNYPAKLNRMNSTGATTAITVQFRGDGIADPHNVFIQLDAVKYQYRCFLETLFRGEPTVFAPKSIDSSCQ